MNVDNSTTKYTRLRFTVVLIMMFIICVATTIHANETGRGTCETIKTFITDGDRHPLSKDLTGKRLWYHYAIGYSVEHHYIDEDTVIWKAVGETAKELTGVFEDIYYAFEISPKIYFLNWCEASSPSRFADEQIKGAFPVAVVLDLNRLIATVTFTEPNEKGGANYVIDQAILEIKE